MIPTQILQRAVPLITNKPAELHSRCHDTHSWKYPDLLVPSSSTVHPNGPQRTKPSNPETQNFRVSMICICMNPQMCKMSTKTKDSSFFLGVPTNNQLKTKLTSTEILRPDLSKTSKQISSSTLRLNKKWSGVAFPWLNEHPIDNLQQSEGFWRFVKGLRNWKHFKAVESRIARDHTSMPLLWGTHQVLSPLICMEFAITLLSERLLKLYKSSLKMQSQRTSQKRVAKRKYIFSNCKTWLFHFFSFWLFLRVKNTYSLSVQIHKKLGNAFVQLFPSPTRALFLNSCKLWTWSSWPSLWHVASTKGQSVLHDLSFV